jgi:hypothetical protein
MTRRLQTAHFGDIARPHVHSDQFSPWYLRVGGVAYDLRHSDAATEKRGLGCSIRRRRNGKPIWCADDQRSHQGDGVAGWLVLFSDLSAFGSLCASLDEQQ